MLQQSRMSVMCEHCELVGCFPESIHCLAGHEYW